MIRLTQDSNNGICLAYQENKAKCIQSLPNSRAFSFIHEPGYPRTAEYPRGQRELCRGIVFSLTPIGLPPIFAALNQLHMFHERTNVMAIEQTLVLIKPDGLTKSLTGNILSRLSESRLEIAGARVVAVTRELAEEHYAELKDRPFFDELINYIMGELHNRRRVMALVYHGEDAIAKVRDICGATNPEEADPRTIRGAYGRITTLGIYENAVHASANPQDAEREIKLWFRPKELVYRIYPVEEIELEKVTRLDWA